MSSFARSFRLVCGDSEISYVEELMREEGFDFEPDPHLPFARRLTNEPYPLGRSLVAFFGLIYIQDRSSMLPPLALAPRIGAGVLDMCASPGSKTGLCAQLIGREGYVLANEPNQTRLATMRHNMQNLNMLNVCTCSYAGEHLPLRTNDNSFDGFDFIVLDPPCSGWGTALKNHGVLDLWKGDKISPLISLQRMLIRQAYSMLKTGGKLVYSTCTTNIDEDEEQVLFAISEMDLKIVSLPVLQCFKMEQPRLNLDGIWRIDPSEDAQGFFVTVFEKTGTTEAKNPHNISNIHTLNHKMNRKTRSIGKTTSEVVSPHILEKSGISPLSLPNGYVEVYGGTAFFIPQTPHDLLSDKISYQGFPLGKYKNGKIIPFPRLRLQGIKSILCLDSINQVQELISGQSIITDISDPIAELRWRDLTLGNVKIKNHRAFWTER